MPRVYNSVNPGLLLLLSDTLLVLFNCIKYRAMLYLFISFHIDDSSITIELI